jgi:hypothetical protein
MGGGSEQVTNLLFAVAACRRVKLQTQFPGGLA